MCKTGSVSMHKAPQEFKISETKYSICITPTYMYFYKVERSMPSPRLKQDTGVFYMVLTCSYCAHNLEATQY